MKSYHMIAFTPFALIMSSAAQASSTVNVAHTTYNIVNTDVTTPKTATSPKKTIVKTTSEEINDVNLDDEYDSTPNIPYSSTFTSGVQNAFSASPATINSTSTATASLSGSKLIASYNATTAGSNTGTDVSTASNLISYASITGNEAGYYTFRYSLNNTLTGNASAYFGIQISTLNQSLFSDELNSSLGTLPTSSKNSYTFYVNDKQSIQDVGWQLLDVFVSYGFSSGKSFGTSSYLGALSWTLTFTPGIPEPATWALMILGMGFTAAAMRHRVAQRRQAGELALA